ncbi:hypothetical protein BC832DRAFT_541241 [Gaertneriomyces semiglobifer]|nr:hypothetical protein BC832DRAFT_541241 [Gaertneriomyces semiglobifer]
MTMNGGDCSDTLLGDMRKSSRGDIIPLLLLLRGERPENGTLKLEHPVWRIVVVAVVVEIGVEGVRPRSTGAVKVTFYYASPLVQTFTKTLLVSATKCHVVCTSKYISYYDFYIGVWGMRGEGRERIKYHVKFGTGSCQVVAYEVSECESTEATEQQQQARNGDTEGNRGNKGDSWGGHTNRNRKHTLKNENGKEPEDVRGVTVGSGCIAHAEPGTPPASPAFLDRAVDHGALCGTALS